MDPVAQLNAAGVSLGGRPVLRDLALTLDPGEIVGVSGPNGSGKTTLVRTLATLIRISEGKGTVLGSDLSTDGVFEVRRSIGLIGHRPALIPELSLRENLDHVAKLAGIETSRIDPVLEVVGLDGAADRRASASSFGMQRRIEVAHLLLTNPRLVLLDEATSGLDESARDLISALAERTAENGGGVVMVSHDRDQLRLACHRTMGLSSGRLETPA